MFSLISVSLVSYLLPLIKTIVTRNPRFRRDLGNVSLTSNNGIQFANLQVIIRDVNTDSTRQSMDYFLCTQRGRAILTKIADKDGAFIRFVEEVDASGVTPTPGVYYLNVDSVDESTRAVGLTMESYRWVQGRVKNAYGTKIVFLPGIDATTLTLTDPSTGVLLPTQYEAHLGYIYLLSLISGLLITDQYGTPLTPLIDYWMEGVETRPLLTTVFGAQSVILPPIFYGKVTLTATSDGYTLVPGSDYKIVGQVITFPAWTPAGEVITITGPVKLDPNAPENLLNAENTLGIVVGPTESLVPGQVFVTTQNLDHVALTVNPITGQVTLPFPLYPGGYCQYEARILTGRTEIAAFKNAVDKGIIPGLRIAIGDAVVEGDQCAIIVSPTLTDTYRVYGGKPGVTFTLDVKANDPATAGEIAEDIRRSFLISQRTQMEADGLTLVDVSESFASTARDDSSTALSTTVSMSFSGLADWREYEPLVTRITSFDVTISPALSKFLGKLSHNREYYCLGASGFIPDYS